MSKIFNYLLSFILCLSSISVSYAEQLEISGGEANWNIQLLPDMEFTGYWYLWSNGGATLTFDPQLSDSPSWLSSLTVDNPVSANCTEISIIQVNIVAPAQTGMYSITITDLNGIYVPINLNLMVTETLFHLDSLFIPGFVNQAIEVPQTEINDGLSDIGCIEQFFPGESQTFSYEWLMGNAPGTASTTPSEITLNNGESGNILNSAIFSAAGVYTTYRISKAQYGSYLLVGKVVFSISEVTAIDDDKLSAQNYPFPNPAISKITFFTKESYELTNQLGKRVMVPHTSNNEGRTELDLSSLETGIYNLKLGSKFHKIVKTD
jgi:hypothetical protein